MYTDTCEIIFDLNTFFVLNRQVFQFINNYALGFFSFEN